MIKLKRIVSLVIIFVLLSSSLYAPIFAGGEGSIDDKVEIDDFNGDGIQTFRFYVAATASNAKFKYKTVGWNVKITPNGKQTYTGRYDFSFTSVDEKVVDLPLEEMFDCANVPDIDREIGGMIEVDAIQVIMVNGRKTYPEYTNSASNIINGIKNRYGIEWNDTTKDDLVTYYDNIEAYQPVSEEIGVDVTLQVTSTDNDHTLDVTKGETAATVKIHAKVDVKTSGKGDYAKDYHNLDTINISLNGQEVTINAFRRLGAEADFIFTYDASEIEDGLDTVVDTIMKDHCDAKVDYKLQYHGKGEDDTQQELKKITSIEEQKKPLALIGYKDPSTNKIVTEEGRKIFYRGTSSKNIKVLDLSQYKEADIEQIEITHNGKSIKKGTIKNQELTVDCDLGGHVFEISFIDKRDNRLYKDRVSFFADEIENNPNTKKPNALIEADTQVRAGDYFYLDGSGSSDEDGTIEKYKWYVTSSQLTLPDEPTVATWFEAKSTGLKASLLTVTDNDSLTDSDVHSFEVLPPTIKGDISHEGRLKVNRKITINSAFDAPKKYPVNRYEWTVPKDYKTNKTFGNDTSIYFLPSQDGAYPVTLKGSNGYYEDTITKTYGILPDIAPIADFSCADVYYRNPYNGNKGEIILKNHSRSTDGDYIKNVKVWYQHDATNKNVYNSDWILGYDGISTNNITVLVDKIGHYKLKIQVTEGFDDTIPSLLTEHDYLKDTQYTIVHVDNKPPKSALEIDVVKKVNIGVAVPSDKNINVYQNYVNTVLNPMLEQDNIKADITLVPYTKNFAINNPPWIYYYEGYEDDDKRYRGAIEENNINIPYYVRGSLSHIYMTVDGRYSYAITEWEDDDGDYNLYFYDNGYRITRSRFIGGLESALDDSNKGYEVYYEDKDTEVNIISVHPYEPKAYLKVRYEKRHYPDLYEVVVYDKNRFRMATDQEKVEAYSFNITTDNYDYTLDYKSTIENDYWQDTSSSSSILMGDNVLYINDNEVFRRFCKDNGKKGNGYGVCYYDFAWDTTKCYDDTLITEIMKKKYNWNKPDTTNYMIVFNDVNLRKFHEEELASTATEKDINMLLVGSTNKAKETFNKY